MPISIKNDATEELARTLSTLTGETITETVRISLQQRYERVRSEKTGRSMADELMEIGRRCAARPRISNMTDDELLGYDEYGIPTL